MNRDDHWKGQHQGNRNESPSCQKLTEHGNTGSDREGQQQFTGSRTSFFCPKPHSHCRDQEQIKPGMKKKGIFKACLVRVVEIPEKKRTPGIGCQKNDDEDVGYRRPEIGQQFTFKNWKKTFHTFPCLISKGQFAENLIESSSFHKKLFNGHFLFL